MRRLLLALAAAHAYDPQKKKTLFVCSNKWCASGTPLLVLGAPLSIAKQPVDVQPHACFGRCGEGPNCAAVVGDDVLEFHGVNSVEKITHILRNHLDIDVDSTAAKCLELHRLAEAAHRRKDYDLALRLYSDALHTRHGPQRAPVLTGRAGSRLMLSKERRKRGLTVARKAKAVPGVATRRVLLHALGSFDVPAAAALLALDAIPSLDATASRVVFELASAEFLARGALSDAARRRLSVPAYGLAWRRLGEALGCSGARKKRNGSRPPQRASETSGDRKQRARAERVVGVSRCRPSRR